MRISRRTLLAAGSLPILGRFAFGAEVPPFAMFPESTPHSRESIARGNRWLMRTFNRDGGCGVDIGQVSDISCSAAVGLALMSQGSTLIEGEFYRQIRGLTRYVVQCIDEGKFNIALNTQVKADLSGYADHHFAALFLSQVLGEGWKIEPVKSALSRLVQQIGSGQSPVGHWGQGRYPRLGAVTGWCSLRGAYLAGLNVDASARTTAKYLISQIRAAQEQNASRNLFVNAAGLRVLYSLGMENEPIAKRAFEDVLKSATRDFPSFSRFGGEQYLAFHLVNETMLKRGGKAWATWFPVVRDKIIDVQNRDGSWTGYSCITARTFCTACALLVLTSPNRYLPISQP